MNISNVEPLTVNSAETDCPLSWVSPGQLGDVGGWLPSHVWTALVVDTLDIKNELIELRYDELAPECFGDENVTLLQKPEVIQVNTLQSVLLVLLVKLILVQFDIIYSKARGIHLAQHCNHVGKSWIAPLNSHCLQLLF